MTIPNKLKEDLTTLCNYINSGEAAEPVMSWCTIHSISERYAVQLDMPNKGSNLIDIVLIEMVPINGHTFFHYLADGETNIPIDEVPSALVKLAKRLPA